MPDVATNVLYWGDNLPILRNRDYFPDESIDLVYLDPPFNSNASYNVLFKEPTGQLSTAQLQAFDDTWHWDDAASNAWADLHATAPKRIQDALDAFQKILVLKEGRFARNDMMAYLVMMTARLLELHRVLKDTGSLYLHCDPTASHYLKVILDTIFGAVNYRNELAWRRYGTHNDVGQGSRHFGRVHDILLFYTKSSKPTWNQVFRPLDPAYVASTYRYVEPTTGRRFATTPLTGPGGQAKGNPVYEWKGHTRAWRYDKDTMGRLDKQDRLYYSRTGYPRQKLYLDESRGVPIQDIWDDIGSLAGAHKERTGYATQKPLILLERIISASSNEGDVVLDPFCGCGTAVLAAHKLGRRWIGIDVTNLAITVMKKRLVEAFPGLHVKVIGEPTTVSEARALAAMEPDGRWQFQWWALGLVAALPASDKRKKGADAGVDGFFSVHHDGKKQFTQVMVQVKSGHVSAPLIRDLKGVVGEDKLGLFITLEEPTQPMKAEAATASLYHNPLMDRRYPRIQILTVEELLAGKKPVLPLRVQGAAGPYMGQQIPQGTLIQ